MTAPAATTALTRAAATNGDVLAIVDRALMYAASDRASDRVLRQRLAILNDAAPVALLGAGEAGHLPRPARALATLIDRATYDEDDWLWMVRTLRSLQLDPDALLVETRRAMPARHTHRVPVMLSKPEDYVLVEVGALPFAHNPSHCDHRKLHRKLERRIRLLRRLRLSEVLSPATAGE